MTPPDDKGRRSHQKPPKKLPQKLFRGFFPLQARNKSEFRNRSTTN